MYFVVKGRLEYLHLKEEDPIRLVQGSWACEPVLWAHWIHCGILRAVTDCTLLSLDAEKFQWIFSPYHSSHARDYATMFVHALNIAPKEELSDTDTSITLSAMPIAFPGNDYGGEINICAQKSNNWRKVQSLASVFSKTSKEGEGWFKKRQSISHHPLRPINPIPENFSPALSEHSRLS